MSAEYVLLLIVSALITALSYGAPPIFFAVIRKRPLAVKYLRIFCVISTFIVWLLWRIILQEEGTISSMPAILWGCVSYSIAKKIFSKKQLPPAIPTQTEERWYTCPKCGQLLPEGTPCDCETVSPPEIEPLESPAVPQAEAAPMTEEQNAAAPVLPQKGKNKAAICLAIVSGILAIGIISLGSYSFSLFTDLKTSRAENEELQKKISTITKENQKLMQDVTELKADRKELYEEYLPAAIFLNHNIGFIVDGSHRYHSYDCPVFQAADEYWAHNIEYCIYLGYSKCSVCWE